MVLARQKGSSPSWSASKTSWYVYPKANWFAMGGIRPLRLSFDKPGSVLVAENVSKNSLWLSGVPPSNRISEIGHSDCGLCENKAR